MLVYSLFYHLFPHRHRQNENRYIQKNKKNSQRPTKNTILHLSTINQIEEAERYNVSACFWLKISSIAACIETFLT